MKYICRNSECSEYEKEEEFSSERFNFRNGRLVGEHSECPVCGKERECIYEKAQVPLSEKSVGIAHFNNKSKNEQREILRKRSHDHFKKEVQERKDHLMHKAMKEMRNLGK